MSTVTIAVDLAEHVFEIAISSRAGTIQNRTAASKHIHGTAVGPPSGLSR